MTSVRKVRWWERFDPAVRDAKRRRVAVESGQMELQIVDYLDDGTPIQMPKEIADGWLELPVEVREEFRRTVAAQKGDGPDGMMEFIG